MDNLKQLKVDIDSVITDANGPDSIPPQSDNNLRTDMLNKLGKYVGLPYLAKFDSDQGVVPVGTLVFNENALNNTNDFVITVARRTQDSNDVLHVLDTLQNGSIMHLKDFVGRSFYFDYKEHSQGVDSNGDAVVNITVAAKADNQNYTYQANEEELCILEFYNKASAGGADYTMTLEANLLKLFKDGVEVFSGDLSLYLDDSNLARLVSGTVENGILTVVRDDSSEFTIDMTEFIDNGIILGNSDHAQAANGTAVISNEGKQISAYEKELIFEWIAGQNTTVLKFGDHFKQNFLKIENALDNTNNFTISLYEALKIEGATIDVPNKKIIFTGGNGNPTPEPKDVYICTDHDLQKMNETAAISNVLFDTYNGIGGESLSTFDGEILTIKQGASFVKVEAAVFCDGVMNFNGNLFFCEENETVRDKASTIGSFGKGSECKIVTFIVPPLGADTNYVLKHSQSAYDQKMQIGSYIRVTKL